MSAPEEEENIFCATCNVYIPTEKVLRCLCCRSLHCSDCMEVEDNVMTRINLLMNFIWVCDNCVVTIRDVVAKVEIINEELPASSIKEEQTAQPEPKSAADSLYATLVAENNGAVPRGPDVDGTTPHYATKEDEDGPTTAEDSVHICSDCNEVFTTLALFTQHIESGLCKGGISAQDSENIPPPEAGANEDVMVYMCATCSKCFSKVSELNEHLRNCTKLQSPRKMTLARKPIGHICTVCGNKFATKRELIIHEEEHDTACKHCGLDFGNRHDLASHVAADHIARIVKNTEDPMQCLICKKRFRTRDVLKQHQLTHEEPRYECAVCNKKYRTAGSLKDHMFQHEDPDRKDFQCDVCNKKFRRRGALTTHQRERHGIWVKDLLICSGCGEEFRKSEELLVHFEEVHSPNLRVYCCNTCAETFKDSGDLALHLRLAHSDDEESVNIVTPAQTQPRPFACRQCGQSYASISVLRSHVQRHNAEKQFTCGQCMKMFKTKAELGKHILIHEEDELFKCNLCTRAFNNKYRLHRHMLNVHRVDKRRENARKPNVCLACGARFAEIGDLGIHLQTAHKKAKSVFQCELCSKSFNTEVNHSKHMLTIHKTGPLVEKAEFLCPVCKKMFSRKSGLTAHLRIHSKEKPLKCPHCDETFRESTSRKFHLTKYHRGQGAYVCEICMSKFHFQRALQKHAKLHTDVNAAGLGGDLQICVVKEEPQEIIMEENEKGEETDEAQEDAQDQGEQQVEPMEVVEEGQAVITTDAESVATQ